MPATSSTAVPASVDSCNVRDWIAVGVAQLVGASLFSIGSACFVWMAWADDWVLPLRLGCGFWIGGCLPYLWPPLRQELFEPHTAAAHVSNAFQVGAMLSWAVGSGFAFRDDLDEALKVTNGGFLAGSACLLLDALLQTGQAFCSTAPVDRDERLSLAADVTAGVFYVLAGGFGGYAVHSTELLRFGNVCWLVGSLISGTRPCLTLSAAGMRSRRPAGAGAGAGAGAPKSVELEAGAAVGTRTAM